MRTFYPTGTASEGFWSQDASVFPRLTSGEGLGRESGADADAFGALTRTRVGRELGEGMVHLAWEVAGYAVEGQSRSVFARFILLSLMNARLGSTRFPVDADEGRLLRAMIGEWLCVPVEEDDLSSTSAPAESPDDVHRAMVTLLQGNALDAVLGRAAGVYKPFLYVEGCFYHQRMHGEEQQLVHRLHTFLGRADLVWPEQALQEALEHMRGHPPAPGGAPIRLEADQEYAVLTAVHSPLTLISGGPGTGKTTVIVSILRLLQRLGAVDVRDVALAAPTGKAAYRMGDSIRRGLAAVSGVDEVDRSLLEGFPEPQTLHRLLGYSPSVDRFRRHQHNRLTARLVIVDEASMIDLNLMDRLLNALDPDARLILLGDADQLPSVDAGAILRELIPSSPHRDKPWARFVAGDEGDMPAGPSEGLHPLAGSAVRLVNNYRMNPANPSGRAVLTVAQAINSGSSEELFGGIIAGSAGEVLLHPRSRPEDLVFDKVEWLALEASQVSSTLESFVAAWYRAQIRGLAPFDELIRRHYSFGRSGNLDAGDASGEAAVDRQALDTLFAHVERSRILTATRVLPTGSQAIHTLLHDQVATENRPQTSSGFYVGEPVMMQRNDYEHGLFNGDQGLILSVTGMQGTAHPMAVFPRGSGYAAFHLDTLREHLRLSYAVTVHKSQGSEYDTVAVVLPTESMPLLTRELLYTAVTRSRKSVVLLGSQGMIEYAVQRRSERYSGIAESLVRVG